MNASLKVAIAAEDGNGDQIIVLDGRADGVRERTAVANAGGTPIAHKVKVQFLKIRCQPCGEQVIGHDFRTGRKAGLDPRLDVQAALDSFLRQQASAQHKRGVRCVGAAGDGGNDHGAARKVKRVAVVSDGNVLGRRSFEDFSKRGLGLAQRDAILRTLGASDSGLDGSQIQLQGVVEEWGRRLIGAKEHLLFAVGFNKSYLLR